MTDLDILVRDKYNGDTNLVTDEDRTRLAAGEPLAYVIGWIPFLGLHIDLSSRPLIPRPETEWWTEQLVAHLKERFGDTPSSTPFRILDLCAGSGAIGLAVLARFPNAHVSFAELMPEHCAQIEKNIKLNNLHETRAEVRSSDLFAAFPVDTDQKWDIIAANPPYIPGARKEDLEPSVTKHEPHEALFSGSDGLDIIRRIAREAPARVRAGGELWLECDISNIEQAQKLCAEAGAARSVILNDQYGRPRLVVSYFGQ